MFPAVLNLASMADISTNATCGSTGPEMFCKLVEHVPGQPIRNAQCRICNQKKQHPIEYAIDGTNRWWQSPSIKNGREYHSVTITLDLKQIAYMIIKAANSPRPGNWILERSIDGVTFDPWQYYAMTDTECLTRFNINPRTGNPSYTRDDEVICTSFYSKIQPLENGEIHASLINGRPSADDPSPTLLNFTSALHQAGVSANQNAERRSHDSDSATIIPLRTSQWEGCVSVTATPKLVRSTLILRSSAVSVNTTHAGKAVIVVARLQPEALDGGNLPDSTCLRNVTATIRQRSATLIRR
ncbi:hypothetical protein F7725_019805 [Dissostichus mawsoni]|uniref:Laminin N-terminal domain-containing protein n=1 Tax=Dissostichus mawsoni TaxID=36200 RepID=A0A7J5YKR3_DISMA|nr:hypothetical protein F7725_019805 [Dissostichus mawsoni]